MPVITIESTKLSKEQKAELVQEMTETAARVMNLPDAAFILDPKCLRKCTFEVFSRKTYDMEKLVKRKTSAVVFNEASCCYLVGAHVHVRVNLCATLIGKNSKAVG